MKIRRLYTSAFVVALTLGTIAMFPGVRLASAATPPACGAVLTSSVTLTADLGPCTGDGLVVAASGITVDLGGHSIIGNNAANFTTADQMGVRLVMVKNVTVKNGKVKNFDAGVWLGGSTGNTVKGVEASNNVAHVLLTRDGILESTYATEAAFLYAVQHSACDAGDGILLEGSNANTLAANYLHDNGPYSGAAAVDGSSKNTFTGNTVSHQQVLDQFSYTNIWDGSFATKTAVGPCGPSGGNEFGPGLLSQDSGIRLEGPGATYNQVSYNTITGNQLTGVAVHGYICSDPAGGNNFNTISHNTITNTFGQFTAMGRGGDGIEVEQVGPAFTVCVSSYTTITDNVITNNARNGIFMGGRSNTGNVILRNSMAANGSDGIRLTGAVYNLAHLAWVPGVINSTISANSAFGNGTLHLNDPANNVGTFDMYDGSGYLADTFSGPCGSNKWSRNSFGSANQSCIH